MKRRLLGIFTNLLVLSFGIISLMAPFVLPQFRTNGVQNAIFPVMISLIIGLCLVILFFEIQSANLDSKMIAFLGVLIAINSGVRFLENAIPGPAGFSPTFFLIILVGYHFGSQMGFLMGAMTMFVSALITGGVGPWLPGQMITAGWVGQSAGLLKPLITSLKWHGKSIEIILLSIFGAVWGLLYGAVMNLWFWPFLGGSAGQSWSQGMSLVENVGRYGTYYLATSLIWDITRAIGNVLVIGLMGRPVLKIFDRFSQRFAFQVIGENQT
jgi:energy-coupling factor transport system substrate-specific component